MFPWGSEVSDNQAKQGDLARAVGAMDRDALGPAYPKRQRAEQAGGRHHQAPEGNEFAEGGSVRVGVALGTNPAPSLIRRG